MLRTSVKYGPIAKKRTYWFKNISFTIYPPLPFSNFKKRSKRLWVWCLCSSGFDHDNAENAIGSNPQCREDSGSHYWNVLTAFRGGANIETYRILWYLPREYSSVALENDLREYRTTENWEKRGIDFFRVLKEKNDYMGSLDVLPFPFSAILTKIVFGSILTIARNPIHRLHCWREGWMI